MYLKEIHCLILLSVKIIYKGLWFSAQVNYPRNRERGLEETLLFRSCSEKERCVFRRNTKALLLEGNALFSLLMEGVKAQTETSEEKIQGKYI